MKVVIDPRLRLVDADGREGGLEESFSRLAQTHPINPDITILVVKTTKPRRWQGRHIYSFAEMTYAAGICDKHLPHQRGRRMFDKELLDHLIGNVIIAYYPDDRTFVKKMTPVQRMAAMADGFSLADTEGYRSFAAKSLMLYYERGRQEYQSVTEKIRYAPSMRAKSKFPEFTEHMNALKELNKLVSAASDYRKAQHLLRRATNEINRSETLQQHVTLPQLPADEWIFKALCGLPRSPFATKGDLTELIAQRPNFTI